MTRLRFENNLDGYKWNGGIKLTELLKLIAPGTPIRDGLENILRAKTGALLLIMW